MCLCWVMTLLERNFFIAFNESKLQKFKGMFVILTLTGAMDSVSTMR
jgi:hypothetical protein